MLETVDIDDVAGIVVVDTIVSQHCMVGDDLCGTAVNV